MAERRMFAKSIVLSDAFLDMPLSARCLYFTLGMLADDEGFVGSPKSIMRQCGATDDDLKILLVKRYVLGFESGVLVIKHWRMNNYLQKDRRKPTTYLEELATLSIDEKGAYTEKNKCIQNVYNMDTQYSIDKSNIDKNSIDKYSIDNNAADNKKRRLTQYLSNKLKETVSYQNYKETERTVEFEKISNHLIKQIIGFNSKYYDSLLKLSTDDLDTLFEETRTALDNPYGTINNQDGYIVSKIKQVIGV